MGKQDLAFKLERVLKLLIGTLDPRIYTLLSQRGFTNEIRREGWDLFLRAGGQLVDMIEPPASDGAPAVQVVQIDEFENEWFDVVDAALGRFFPQVHDRVFKNLHKSSDEGVVLTVSTLLDRIDALESQGGAGREALLLLGLRGFNPEVRRKGRTLLEQLTKGQVVPLATPDPAAEAERQKAEDELWDFYLDWSKTARTVVRRKDLRIKLGISSPTRSAAEPEVVAPPAGDVQASND